MDNIRKFIQRLDKKSALRIEKILLDILNLDLSGYKTEKLKGYKDLYRIRAGKIRIVFRKTKINAIPIDIDFRGDIYQKI